MATSFLNSMLRTLTRTAIRTATHDVVHKKTSGRWECPSCGVMKAAQAAKHEVDGSIMCTKCKNKVVRDG